MIVLDIGVPPTAPLSLNEERTMHWAAVRRRTHPWRNTTWALAVKAKLKRQVDGHACVVTVVLPVADKRRRDPANFYPTVKAVVDGLVMAGVWPDDTPEWVTTTEAVLQVGGTAQVRLELRDVNVA